MPMIDFDAYTVIGVSRGVGIRCFSPRITDVYRVDNDLVVVYREPPTTGPITLACAHPWPLTDFIRVPAVQGSVWFEASRPF